MLDQATGSRIEPYKTFKFRLEFGADGRTAVEATLRDPGEPHLERSTAAARNCQGTARLQALGAMRGERQ